MGKVYFLIVLAIIELIGTWVILLFFIAPAAFPKIFEGLKKSIFKKRDKE